jgi:hypothetical protein
MKRLAALLFCSASAFAAQPTVTRTPAPTSTSTPTQIPTPAATPTVTPTPSPEPTPRRLKRLSSSRSQWIKEVMMRSVLRRDSADAEPVLEAIVYVTLMDDMGIETRQSFDLLRADTPQSIRDTVSSGMRWILAVADEEGPSAPMQRLTSGTPEATP